MAVDQVAVKREQLRRAAEGGSLNNELQFRAEIERLQGNIPEYKPSVVDISSSAERQFAADIVNLKALLGETKDPEIARLGKILVRALTFLSNQKEK
jgi:hypothetical protein